RQRQRTRRCAMSVLEIAATTIPAVARSGMLKPVGPRAFYRIARTVHNSGANSAALVSVAAARWPDRTAVIDDAGALTYAELQARISSTARVLYHDNGVRPGEAVGVMCRNSRSFVQSVLAVASLGADVILLN